MQLIAKVVPLQNMYGRSCNLNVISFRNVKTPNCTAYGDASKRNRICPNNSVKTKS